MKTANLNLRITGIRGHAPKEDNNKGRVVNSIDDTGTILIDAFEGQGASYKRRTESEICISEHSDYDFEWTGTIKELIALCRKDNERKEKELNEIKMLSAL